MPVSPYEPVLVYATITLSLSISGLLGVFLFQTWKNLRKYLILKVGNENFLFFKNAVDTIVKALAQNPAYAELVGSELKQIAMTQGQLLIEKFGLPFGEKEIDDMIEACYAEFKRGVLTGKAPRVIEAAG